MSRRSALNTESRFQLEFRRFRKLLATVAALGATAGATACNGTGQTPVTPAPQFAEPDASRVPPKRLAVSEYNNTIVILDSTYRTISKITDGLNDPECIFYDRHENLYVSNVLGGKVTEYDPKGRLTFTYSSDLTEPGCPTADDAGNVYVADFDYNSPSVVVEYPQKSNTPSAMCFTGRANGGIVVDVEGDVFVTGFNPSESNANILEYKGGLGRCRAKTLLVTLSFAMGMKLDRHDALVVADQQCCVEIIPPPYDSITRIITGAEIPVDLALTKSNGLIYIVDAGPGDILVATYPEGKILTTLGLSKGLASVQGVATYPYL